MNCKECKKRIQCKKNGTICQKEQERLREKGVYDKLIIECENNETIEIDL